MDKIDFSVIVPFYNEAENLPRLHEELMNVLRKQTIKSEVVYIDDGSSDSSLQILEEKVEKTKKSGIDVNIVELMHNFGQTAAVKAGIDNCRGNLVSFLDADLQNDPRDLPRFLEKLNEGYDAVFGWRKERKDATFRSFLSRVANRIINAVFNYPYKDVGCSARIVNKEVLSDIQLYGELHRIMPVLIYLRGAKIGQITVKHRSRFQGKSKYGFDRIIKTIIDIITVKFLSSYGTRPAYVFSSFGLASLFIGGLTLLLVAYRKLFLGVYVHTDPLFLITIFLVLLGVQFMLMGLLAELQVRTYFESQKKSIYEVKKKTEL